MEELSIPSLLPSQELSINILSLPMPFDHSMTMWNNMHSFNWQWVFPVLSVLYSWLSPRSERIFPPQIELYPFRGEPVQDILMVTPSLAIALYGFLSISYFPAELHETVRHSLIDLWTFIYPQASKTRAIFCGNLRVWLPYREKVNGMEDSSQSYLSTGIFSRSSLPFVYRSCWIGSICMGIRNSFTTSHTHGERGEEEGKREWRGWFLSFRLSQ